MIAKRRLSAANRKEVGALGLLVFAAAAWIAFYVVHGHRSYFIDPDNSDQFFAWYQKAASVLHSGSLPLWDRNTLAGHSFVGEGQTGVFYPVNLAYLLLLGGAQGIGRQRLEVLVGLHSLLASVGFYLLSRSFGVRRALSVAAGLAFAYSGVVATRASAQTAIFFGLCWLPFVALGVRLAVERGRLRWAAAAGAALGLSVLAGHFQPFACGLIIVFSFLLLTPAAGGLGAAVRARAAALGTCLLTAAVVSLPQLVASLVYLGGAYRFTTDPAPAAPGHQPSFNAFAHAYRASLGTYRSLLDPQRFPSPDGSTEFVGLALLVLLAVALIRFRAPLAARLGRFRRPVAFLGLFGFVASLGDHTPLARILYHVPLFGQVRSPVRYEVLVHLALCLVAACGLEAIVAGTAELSGSRRRVLRLACAGAGAGILVVAAAIRLGAAPRTHWWIGELALAGAALAVLALAARRSVALGPALAVVVILAALTDGYWVLGSWASPYFPAQRFASSPTTAFLARACAGHRTQLDAGALSPNVGDVNRNIETVNGYGATLPGPYWILHRSDGAYDGLGARLLDTKCWVTPQATADGGFALANTDATTGLHVFVRSVASRLNTPQGRPVPARLTLDGDTHRRFVVTVRRRTRVVLGEFVTPRWVVTVDGRPAGGGAYSVDGHRIFPQFVLAPGRHVVDYRYDRPALGWW